MRDRDAIDAQLRRLAAVRRSIREHGGEPEPSSRQVDELLDERLGHCAEASAEARETGVVTDIWSQWDETGGIMPIGHKGVLRRFGLRAALPLSLVAAATVLVVMFAVHDRYPAAQPTVVPPPSARPSPAAPKAPAPPIDIADRAFIDALKLEGVSVPSHEYVMIQEHAVCDFLARQPNFAEAVRFVQQSSVWDANQSASFAASAIVSYCPQYESPSSDAMRQVFQNALSDLQALQGDVQNVQDDLQAILGHQ